MIGRAKNMANPAPLYYSMITGINDERIASTIVISSSEWRGARAGGNAEEGARL
jgi:hypothetical protein